MIRLKLAETLGKSYTWIQKNITVKELKLWVLYWEYQHKKETNIPTRKVSTETQVQKLNQIAKALGAKVVTRQRGT